jgi:hypothetical protein
MYEERYGTDWEELDTEEAIERAYALGMLAELGHGLPDEYERVEAAIDADPGAHMVELAYREGHQAVSDIDVDARTAQGAWQKAIRRRGDQPDTQESESRTEGSSESVLPSSPARFEAPEDGPGLLTPPEDGPGMLTPPEFLWRD